MNMNDRKVIKLVKEFIIITDLSEYIIQQSEGREPYQIEIAIANTLADRGRYINNKIGSIS